MLTFLILGAGIGVVAGISPGPVLTMVVLETFRGGWLRGSAVAAGPLLADGPIVLVAVLVLAQLPAGLIPAVSLVGGVFLLYLGATTLLATRRPRPTHGAGPRAGLLKGVLARALSPNPYLFWFLVGGPLVVQAGPSRWWFLLGYYTTIVGSNVVLALALHRWVGQVSDRVYRALLLVSGALLLVYGAALAARGVSTQQPPAKSPP
jgi:threonine/homoserine/homoserine lactone efflux protein